MARNSPREQVPTTRQQTSLTPSPVKNSGQPHRCWGVFKNNKYMENKKLQVGQILYEEVTQRGFPSRIRPRTISKIGKKYLYVEGDDRYPISIDTLMHENKNYSQYNFQLYLTEQEILDIRERGNLIEKLRKTFDWSSNKSGITLEQLRQISGILNPDIPSVK